MHGPSISHAAFAMGLLQSRNPAPFSWRFVHTDSFLLEGHIEIRHLSHIPDDFVAVSYTWSPAIKAWRDRVISTGIIYCDALKEDPDFWEAAKTQKESRRMAQMIQEHEYAARVWLGSHAVRGILDQTNDPSLDEANRFLETVAFTAHTRGQDWFWIDILCIDQDNVQEKEYFVSQMGELYRRATETHVYLFGTSFVSELTSPAVYSPLWMTRAWTMQEHLLSKSVFFCYTFAGDVTDELRKYLTHIDPTKPASSLVDFTEQQIPDEPTRPFDWLKVHTLVSPSLGYIASWANSRHTTSCIVEHEVKRGLGPFLAATLCDKILEVNGDWFNTNIKGPAYHNYATASLYATLMGHVTKAKPGSPREFARSMAEISRRNSTITIDKIYSMLQIFNRTDFPVSYSADPQDVRLSILESMSPEMLGATLATEWGCYTDSGRNDSALPRIFDSSPLPKFEIEELYARAHFRRSIGTTVDARTGKFRLWMDGQALVRTLDFQRSVAASEPMANEHRKAGIRRLAVLNAVDLTRHPDYEHYSTADIPKEDIHAAFLDSATRLSLQGIANCHDLMVPVMEHLPWWRGNSSTPSDHSFEETANSTRDWMEHTSQEVQVTMDELARYDEVVHLLEVGQCRHTNWYPQARPETHPSSVVVGGGNMLDVRGVSGVSIEVPKRKSSLLALQLEHHPNGSVWKNKGTIIVEYLGSLTGASQVQKTLIV